MSVGQERLGKGYRYWWNRLASSASCFGSSACLQSSWIRLVPIYFHRRQCVIELYNINCICLVVWCTHTDLVALVWIMHFWPHHLMRDTFARIKNQLQLEKISYATCSLSPNAKKTTVITNIHRNCRTKVQLKKISNATAFAYQDRTHYNLSQQIKLNYN